MKFIYISEKPSVNNLIKEYFIKKFPEAHKTEEDKLKISSLLINGDEHIFIPLSGHILRLKKVREYKEGQGLSWKNIALSKTPFIPSVFEKIPLENTSYDKILNFKSQLINKIKELVLVADEVYNLADADPAGQLLFDEIFDYLYKKDNKLDLRKQVPFYRVFLRATDKVGIKRAFEQKILNQQCLSMKESEECRELLDWIWGINLTVLATETLGLQYATEKNNHKTKTLMNIGRVQTPVLNLIYQREQDIAHFQEQVFYNIIGKFNSPNTVTGQLNFKNKLLFDFLSEENTLDESGRLLSQPTAIRLQKAFKEGKSYFVEKATTKKVFESPPLPLSIEVLQGHMSKKYGMSASDTLEAAQSLYMKQILSYPRNNGARYLPKEMQEDIPHILNALQGIDNELIKESFQWVDGSNLSSKAWDDSKVESHYALVPTSVVSNAAFMAMNENEKNVFLDVVFHYLYMFMPPAIKNTLEAVVKHDSDPKLEFLILENTYVDRGFRQAFNQYNDKDSVISDLNEGQYITLDNIEITSGKTSPPKLFNSGDLVYAMEHAYKYVEDKSLATRLKGEVTGLTDEGKEFQMATGIGTSATRSEIINKLCLNHYVNRDKQDRYTTTEKAKIILQHLPNEFIIPDNTAHMQLLLDDIRKGDSELGIVLNDQIRIFKQTFYSLAEHLGEPINFFDVPKNTVISDAKPCPECHQLMNKIVTEKNGEILSIKYNCVNAYCSYSEDEYEGKTYKHSANIPTEHHCLSCHSRLGYFCGFSYKKLNPYYILKCTNAKCGKIFKSNEDMGFDYKQPGTPTDYCCFKCKSPVNELKGIKKDNNPYHFFICSNINCNQKYFPNNQGEPIIPKRTAHQCSICHSSLLEIRGVNKEQKEYYYFRCENESCKKTYSKSSDGQPIYPKFSTQKCPHCCSDTYQLVLKKGISQKNNRPYAFYICENPKCKNLTYEVTDNDEVNFNYCEYYCIKCNNQKLSIREKTFRDKKTNAIKSIKKFICFKCLSEYDVDRHTNMPVFDTQKSKTIKPRMKHS